MFPASFLSGIVFPAIVALVQASAQDRMNSTGITTLFNTTGAAAGPLIATFVLLPAVGYQWSLLLCAAGYVLFGILASEGSSWSIRRPIGVATIVACATAMLLVAIVAYHPAESHFEHASRPYETDEDGKVLAHVVKRIEGTSDTLQLLRRDLFGEPSYLPAPHQRLFDVRDDSSEPAIHAIIRVSPIGSSSRIRRRTAYLLWLWSDGGRIPSRIKHQEIGYRGHFERSAAVRRFLYWN